MLNHVIGVIILNFSGYCFGGNFFSNPEQIPLHHHLKALYEQKVDKVGEFDFIPTTDGATIVKVNIQNIYINSLQSFPTKFNNISLW